MRSRSVSLRGVGRLLAIVLVGAGFLAPLYWMVTMSFKPQAEWNPIGQTIWFPHHPTLDNFRNILGLTSQNTVFFQANSTDASGPIVHSLIAATGGTLIALFIGVLAAYGIARFRAGGRMLPFQILQLRMFPPVAIIIPLLIMMSYLHLVDTYPGLWLVYGAVTFPFVVWLMRSFFQDLPREIGEAAIVDGCTQWGALFKAILPNVKGGLAATALFVFILNWSDFLIALVLTQQNVVTAPVFLNSLQSAGAGQEYGPQAALGLILILPPAILGLVIQRYLVRGLTFGAIKR
ncbi:MAG: carbohydrate ABC transporter permease [Solirubrobacterales bacterium]|nr:carbohydrate ABC transporter permease [Solirubrobacterales bacterium]MBV9715730.1 carbohydrate ABC transporter permease [Solirubrobacterales bacterium]